MGILSGIAMAFKSITANLLRAILTMLGVVIGVSAVVVLVAIAQGSNQKVKEQIMDLGTNLINIEITGRSSNINISYENLQKFASVNNTIISGITPIIKDQATVKYENRNIQVDVEGVSPEYEKIRNFPHASGRFIVPADLGLYNYVCVVGANVSETLFGDFNPIGADVNVNGYNFKVVGTLVKKGASGDLVNDNKILIPATVSQRILKRPTINNYSLQASSDETVDIVMEKMTEYLTGIYKDPSRFKILNQAQMLKTINESTRTLTLMLGGIAAISLLVGGIGIMNIMVVTVTERTREIGIRKAIGAKRRNILFQFLIESVVLSSLGGIIGILLGFAGSKIAAVMFHVPTLLSLDIILISFSFSFAVGVAFGIYPAFKASRMLPIEALRYE